MQIATLVMAGIFLFQARWWWLGATVLGVLYLGAIGAKLHPLQSASDLAEGPLGGPAARAESEALPPEVKRLLVSRACTKVAIRVGLVTAAVA